MSATEHNKSTGSLCIIHSLNGCKGPLWRIKLFATDSSRNKIPISMFGKQVRKHLYYPTKGWQKITTFTVKCFKETASVFSPPTKASPAPLVSTMSSSFTGMIGYSVTLPSTKISWTEKWADYSYRNDWVFCDFAIYKEFMNREISRL